MLQVKWSLDMEAPPMTLLYISQERYKFSFSSVHYPLFVSILCSRRGYMSTSRLLQA